jgi:hypothetical protein
METLDPKDQTNQTATNELLIKSNRIKEKARKTLEKLGRLKSKFDDFTKETQNPIKKQ